MSANTLSRRKFLSTATTIAAGMHVFAGKSCTALAETVYNPPRSPRSKLNFNLNWRFIRQDVPGADAPAFDDSKWTTISTPHTFNDIDSFRELISHSNGDVGTYKGLSWYRKRFKLPVDLSRRKVFLEFEGMRQAGDIFLNGREVGLYENGVTAYGIDITDAVYFGSRENLLAVKVDNRSSYEERATGTRFEWNVSDFNPNFGGINRNVWLHVTDKIYQTLPLDYGLKTSGVYVHASNFDIERRSAEVAVDSEVSNDLDTPSRIGLSVVIVDQHGDVCAQFLGEPVEMAAREKTVLTAMGRIRHARFWSPADPYLYDVYSILEANGKVVDVEKIVTGFRKTEFRGGAGKGGVYINDKFIYLKGFAQRATNEWAALGQAYPGWLHDYTASMIRASHANYVRWMHISPQKVDADTMARYGIIQICPAGDKERDALGRQWDQRVEVMRASMVYFRNNPSILFYEAGNTVVTVEQMEQMVALRKQWDPHGGRVVGYRDNDDLTANVALTPIAEYYEVMIGQAPQTDALRDPHAMFRGYSWERRDRAPIIEAEDFRDECARRYWDDCSPPFFTPKQRPHDTYHHTQESFTLAGVKRYWDYQQNCICHSDLERSKWSGYASIYFSDSDADGRQDSSEVCRVSGKVDAVRLPKEIYFAHRVMQNENPDLHILGHWSYPVAEGQHTVKTVYVISNAESVELFLNGKTRGVNAKPETGYIFAFPEIEFTPGTLRALARNGRTVVGQRQLSTVGAPVRIRLTPIVGPLGLHADGQDIALIDCEVVDAGGQRCPTDYGRVDFTCTGPAVWRGGYNSGIVDSTNNLYLYTELGINRVAVQSTLSAGAITVTASRTGLEPAATRLISRRVELIDGISTFMPPGLPPTVKIG
jgi:beta-galactosidase